MTIDTGALRLPLCLAAALLACSLPARPATPQIGEANYQVVPGWPVRPDGLSFGQVPGVDVNSRGEVFIFQRGSNFNALTPRAPGTLVKEPTVLVFDGPSGKLIRRWGENRFMYPHGVTIDSHDNLWLTDIGLHQVYKFSADGQLLLTLGEAGKPGDDDRHFNGPSDVAVAPDGTFYVSDGYWNNRVLKFSPDGTLLGQWGSKGTAPGQFNLPHSVDLDDQGRVYVADRGNKRVQIFDRDGHFLEQWPTDCGVPYTIKVRSGKRFLADGGDLPGPVNRSKICLLNAAGRTEKTFGRLGRYDGELDVAHDLAVDPRSGAVYVVDILGQRVQKFVPKEH